MLPNKLLRVRRAQRTRALLGGLKEAAIRARLVSYEFGGERLSAQGGHPPRIGAIPHEIMVRACRFIQGTYMEYGS